MCIVIIVTPASVLVSSRVFFAMRGAAVIVKCLKCKNVLTQLARTVLHLLHIAQLMLEQYAIYFSHKHIVIHILH